MNINNTANKYELNDDYEDFFDKASDKANQSHDDLAVLEKELEQYSRTDRNYNDEAMIIARKLYEIREELQDVMYELGHIESAYGRREKENG